MFMLETPHTKYQLKFVKVVKVDNENIVEKSEEQNVDNYVSGLLQQLPLWLLSRCQQVSVHRSPDPF